MIGDPTQTESASWKQLIPLFLTPYAFFPPQETQEQSGSSDSKRQEKGQNGGTGTTSYRIGTGGNFHV